ncbi:MAG: hypothetical protein GAK31_00401 [Stenotrophomonas maltophilia]|uniref:Response regulatory domain-containing protein n=1 Tax=Stenotrophomonas maltophilia TaxID=40324 RepID=A0A7V8JMV9_STEMA|nr:MAG: hypothetical protein GAK31_00401 [Stenotrophomonas maltophilia]
MNGIPLHPPVRIALLDDHEIMRRGTGHHLSFDRRLQVVANCSTAECLLARLQQTPADVAVIDYALGLDDLPGESVVERLQQAHPACAC